MQKNIAKFNEFKNNTSAHTHTQYNKKIGLQNQRSGAKKTGAF